MTQIRIIRVNDKFEVQSRTKGILFYGEWVSKPLFEKHKKWEEKDGRFDYSPPVHQFKKYTDAINDAQNWHRFFNPDIEVCKVL